MEYTRLQGSLHVGQCSLRSTVPILAEGAGKRKAQCGIVAGNRGTVVALEETVEIACDRSAVFED